MAPLDSPCLMNPLRGISSWEVFHSLHNDFHYLDFPEIMGGAEICFSKDGWLLMSGDKDIGLFFFNPFTREKHELPPTACSLFSVCFTSPPSCSDCFVFAILEGSTFSKTQFGLIKFGDHEWTLGWLDNGMYKFWPSNCPPLFHRGVYYCLDYKLNIRKFDPREKDESRWLHFGNHSCHEKTQEEEKNEEKDDDEEEKDEEEGEEQEDEEEEEEDVIHNIYMVEVEGDIWGVFVRNHIGQVSVEKLDLSEMRWKKLESLGDKCLYLSTKGSFAETCVDGDLANKIYFNKLYGKSGVVYSLSSGMYHSVDGKFTTKDADSGLTQVTFGAWIKPTFC